MIGVYKRRSLKFKEEVEVYRIFLILVQNKIKMINKILIEEKPKKIEKIHFHQDLGN